MKNIGSFGQSNGSTASRILAAEPSGKWRRHWAAHWASCERCAEAVAREVTFPPGFYVAWSGQFEYLQRAEAKLKVVVPVTLLLIFLLPSQRDTWLPM